MKYRHFGLNTREKWKKLGKIEYEILGFQENNWETMKYRHFGQLMLEKKMQKLSTRK